MPTTSVGNEDFPEDVYFCQHCGKPFTELGDKLRHVFEEHGEVEGEEQK